MQTNRTNWTHPALSRFFPIGVVWLLAALCSGQGFGEAADKTPAADETSTAESQAAESQESTPEETQPALIEAGSAKIQALIEGDGHPVVLLPAMGRGAADFTDLSARLVAAGFRVVRPQPRGIGSSTGPTKGLTLHDLGNDIAAVIQAVGGGPATLVGHAFGSRIARIVAADHPHLVKVLVLLAAEERQPTPPDILHAELMSYDPNLSAEVRKRVIQKAFFAKANDPGLWQAGWHRKVTRMQMAANHTTQAGKWLTAGTVQILLLQGTEDKLAPPENARQFKQQHGKRVTLVEIANAAHAMLPEQPAAIAEAIISFLQRQESQS